MEPLPSRVTGLPGTTRLSSPALAVGGVTSLRTVNHHRIRIRIIARIGHRQGEGEHRRRRRGGVKVGLSAVVLLRDTVAVGSLSVSAQL